MKNMSINEEYGKQMINMIDCVCKQPELSYSRCLICQMKK